MFLKIDSELMKLLCYFEFHSKFLLHFERLNSKHAIYDSR